MRLLPLCLAASLLLTACGSGTQDSTSEEVEGVIPEHQLKALEKAEDVEDLLDAADKARRETADG